MSPPWGGNAPRRSLAIGQGRRALLTVGFFVVSLDRGLVCRDLKTAISNARQQYMTGAITAGQSVPVQRGAGAFARTLAFGVMLGAAALMAGAHAPAKAQLQPGVNAPLSFADIVERVKPSVVSIQVRSGVRTTSSRDNDNNNRRRGGNGSRAFPDLPPDHPLNEFFRDVPRPFGRQAPNRRSRPARSQGSGFIISEDGFVVTNHHVVRDADEVTVVFDDGEDFKATVVGTDQRTDLAVLKIEAADKTFTPVRFSADAGRVGDWVIAVGNPFGLGGTVTVGVISALSRDIGSSPYDFMQVDAAINRGNSGGPTFNLKGEVVGVNTAIYSPSGGNVGIAFAVPASTAAGIVEELKENKTVRRGWLGVRIQTIDDDIAASLGLPQAQGALISEVTEGGPADSSELRSGDAILKVDGEEVKDSRDLARKVAAYRPGATIPIEVRRGNRDMTIPVKLGTFPTGNQTAASEAPPEKPKSAVVSMDTLGLQIGPSDDPEKKGVVIREVDPDSGAADKGVTAGDLIVQVNGQDVTAPSDVRAAVKRARELGRPSVLFMLETSRGRRPVAVPFMKKAG